MYQMNLYITKWHYEATHTLCRIESNEMKFYLNEIMLKSMKIPQMAYCSNHFYQA